MPTYEDGKKCISATYDNFQTDDVGASSFNIVHCGRMELNDTNRCSDARARSAVMRNPDGSPRPLQGKFGLSFAEFAQPYWVLRFDEYHSIVYSCKQNPSTGSKTEVAWILARSPYWRMDSRYSEAVDYAQTVGISRDAWITTQQWGCWADQQNGAENEPWTGPHEPLNDQAISENTVVTESVEAEEQSIYAQVIGLARDAVEALDVDGQDWH